MNKKISLIRIRLPAFVLLLVISGIAGVGHLVLYAGGGGSPPGYQCQADGGPKQFPAQGENPCQSHLNPTCEPTRCASIRQPRACNLVPGGSGDCTEESGCNSIFVSHVYCEWSSQQACVCPQQHPPGSPGEL